MRSSSRAKTVPEISRVQLFAWKRTVIRLVYLSRWELRLSTSSIPIPAAISSALT